MLFSVNKMAKYIFIEFVISCYCLRMAAMMWLKPNQSFL